MVDDRSIGDMVVDEMLELRGLVRAELREQYKKKKPLRSEPIKKPNQWTPEYEMYLRQTIGDEAVDIMIQDQWG